MQYIFNIYLIPLIISSGLSFTLFIYSFIHRKTRGAKELAACTLILAHWVTSNALEFASPNLEIMLFWANMQYIAYAFIPLCLFTLVFRFNGKEKYITRRNIMLLSIIPAITSVLVWFDPVLGLVRHSFSRQIVDNIPYITKTFGLWFWVHFIYTYGINFTAFGFLITAVSKKGSIFRYQSIYLLIGFSVVFAVNLSYVFGFSLVQHHDLTPIAFSIAVMIVWWGIFRHRTFFTPSIARANIFELMANGILVVDEYWHLIDTNESARKMFHLQKQNLIGKNLRESLPPLAKVTEPMLCFESGKCEQDLKRWEITLQSTTGKRFFELNTSRLLVPHYETAWVIIVTDVTELKQAQERIIHQREEIAAAAECDRLSMELHDNLGQVLSFAVIQTDTVLRELGKPNYNLAISYITKLRMILKNTHQDLRSFVRGIRATRYETMGLIGLLKNEIDHFQHSCGIPVSFKVSTEEADFSPSQKNHLAGILKEVLNNIAKHAQASEVCIDFTFHSGEYQLFIEDNGIGLLKNPQNTTGGSGLDIIRQRAESVRGTLSINSKTEGGTQVVLSFPGKQEELI